MARDSFLSYEINRSNLGRARQTVNHLKGTGLCLIIAMH